MPGFIIFLKISVLCAFSMSSVAWAQRVQAQAAPQASAVAATATSPVLTNIRMTWYQSARNFRGLQYFSFPAAELEVNRGEKDPSPELSPALDFWLLPNRDLNKPVLSREQEEFRSGSPDVEWPFAQTGLGVLSIKNVSVSTTSSACPTQQDELLRATAALDWRGVGFERHDSERHLRVELQKDNRARCYFLRLSFIFEPMLGEGNFALGVDGEGHFSGPIFALWKNRPISSRLRFRSLGVPLTVDCSNCRRDPATREDQVEFTGLPPVLHVLTTQERAEKTTLKIEKAETLQSVSNAQFDGEVLQTVRLFQEFVHSAAARLKKDNGKEWSTTLRPNILLERLIVEQEGEIQLHPTFGKVNPLLGDYHRAALFRALSRDFLRDALQPTTANDSWTARRDNETLARLLAELWLVNSFPRLKTLKTIADEYSFFPFFRAIQQGNAFLNNSVFVGSEETPGILDFNLMHEFYAPLSGAMIVDRVRRCSSPESFSELERMAGLVAKGEISIPEFINRVLSAKKTESCATPMVQGLLPAVLPEEEIEIFSVKDQLQVKRLLRAQPASQQFIFSNGSSLPREPLDLLLEDSQGNRQTLLLSADSEVEKNIALPKSIARARVNEPNRAVSDARLTWPRPLRVVLQALSMNYDSRRSDLVLNSQLQTTQTGDEWGRALIFGYRRELARNNVELQFSSKIPSLVPKTDASISLSSSTRLVQAPPSYLAISYAVGSGSGSVLYPEGVQLKLWLRRPLSLAAFQERMLEPNQEWIFSSAAALAPRLTWSENFSYGVSSDGVDVGLRSVPGWPAERFVSTEYAQLRSELRHTLAQNLNAPLARSLLFQHAILYGAHVVAFDQFQAERQISVDARVAQSLVFGLRLFGALFGTKDQAVSFEVARALTSPARTSFGFSVGKAAN